LKIRPPQTGNGAGLAQSWLDAGLFYNQLAPDLFQVPEQKGLAGWFEEGLLKIKPDELYLVAEYSGQAIGFIEAVIEMPLADSAWQFIRDLSYPRLYINALVIQQAYWRHGIGKQLLLAAEKWGQNRGAHIALLDTFIESPISVSFYEQRMGYQRRSIRFQKLFS
jgi:GNAT superfamily N-acetyltransferase